VSSSVSVTDALFGLMANSERIVTATLLSAGDDRERVVLGYSGESMLNYLFEAIPINFKSLEQRMLVWRLKARDSLTATTSKCDHPLMFGSDNI
jgi:hypothetical protein